jgi:hypothetical protein
MNTTVKALGFGLATVLLASTIATAAGNMNNRPAGNGQVNPTPGFKKVSCQVAGTPSEFPDDVTISNVGNVSLPAGTKIHWAVPSAQKAGVYVLTAALTPNHREMISGALPGGEQAGATCSASIMS